jgi:hypothetical protein
MKCGPEKSWTFVLTLVASSRAGLPINFVTGRFDWQRIKARKRPKGRICA